MSCRENINILIVDDESICTNTLVNILEPVYNVHTVNNGHSAIRLALELVPDLVILDILMPDLSGYDVFESLKSNSITRDIPVIFITGLNSAHEEVKGLFLGAVDYVTKPFNDSIVLARVRTHVQIIKHIRKIEQKCLIDSLTDISNRRGFDDRLHLEWMRAAREKTPLSLIIIDIDHFKFFNDNYGHTIGDMLLQSVSRVCKQTIQRATDFAARWGGDEFIVLLPNTGLSGALNVAEKIRARAEKLAIPVSDGSTISITVSIGVNSITPSADDIMKSFIEDTDKALYMAKNKGRNFAYAFTAL